MKDKLFTAPRWNDVPKGEVVDSFEISNTEKHQIDNEFDELLKELNIKGDK